MSAPFYLLFGTFIALGIIAWVCERKTRNRPKNRYRKDVLPAPSKEALRQVHTQSL